MGRQEGVTQRDRRSPCLSPGLGGDITEGEEGTPGVGFTGLQAGVHAEASRQGRKLREVPRSDLKTHTLALES